MESRRRAHGAPTTYHDDSYGFVSASLFTDMRNWTYDESWLKGAIDGPLLDVSCSIAEGARAASVPNLSGIMNRDNLFKAAKTPTSAGGSWCDMVV